MTEMNEYIDEGLAFKWQLLKKDPFSILFIKDATPEMQLKSLSVNQDLFHFLEDPSEIAQRYMYNYHNDFFVVFVKIRPEKVKIKYKL